MFAGIFLGEREKKEVVGFFWTVIIIHRTAFCVKCTKEAEKRRGVGGGGIVAS